MALPKQKAAFKRMLENGGNASRAMLEVGYSPNTAKTPQKLTESIGFKELSEEFLPDSLLLKVHKEGLEANKIISATIAYGEADEHTNDFIEVPDHPTRHKYLETGYKIKGRLSDKESGGDKTLIINITEASAERYGIKSSPNPGFNSQR